HQHCCARRAQVSPAERLALTIRYLSTENSQASLSFNFRLGHSSVCNIIKESCCAIWQALQPEYDKSPDSPQDWMKNSDDLEKIWNFSNCIGAIDGKNIVIQAPSNSGSIYFNYKETQSIVLMAVCNANYRFIFVDFGDFGPHSDGGVLSNSSFRQSLENCSLKIPPCHQLPGSSHAFPYVIMGDEPFPLKTYMMRQFPGQHLDESKAIYNYRLSKARRVIECFWYSCCKVEYISQTNNCTS
uniref:DDE Tnp4 domain-containing protein n=2 Tax=Amphimedon queenslandica TaxID=400682 RepID=A0A1X7TCR5_AMPQE